MPMAEKLTVPDLKLPAVYWMILSTPVHAAENITSTAMATKLILPEKKAKSASLLLARVPAPSGSALPHTRVPAPSAHTAIRPEVPLPAAPAAIRTAAVAAVPADGNTFY